MKKSLIDKLHDFIDEFETEYGDIVGFEVTIDHPVVDGYHQEHANITEFIVKRIKKEEIKIE